MKEINENLLNTLKDEYLNNPINTVSRHALTNSKIIDIVRVNEQTENTRNMFSINIETLPACNQKSSGRCWIFAGLNVIREKIAKKYNLENFELSQSYVAFYDKLEKCNYFISSIINLIDKDVDDRTLSFILQNGIEDGGQWDMFVNVVNKYGIVPKSAYPETFQSSNTLRLNKILNRYLRKFTMDIRKIKDNKTEIENKYNLAIKDIYKILCNSLGVPPTKFNFEYVNKDKQYNIIKNITPMEFLNNYAEINLNNYVSIINSPTKDKPFYDTYTVKYLGNVLEGNIVKYLNLPMDRFKTLIISQLKDLEPVWFGSDCRKYSYSDKTEGYWDDLSFDEDSLFQIDSKISKEDALYTHESMMNHAMVITGVNLDEEIPTKWKIENSWGEEKAYKGYHVASDSWFSKYVYQAVINKKYLSEDELRALSKNPIELNPWDPMGTLA